jgi:hypothetical protein
VSEAKLLQSLQLTVDAELKPSELPASGHSFVGYDCIPRGAIACDLPSNDSD